MILVALSLGCGSAITASRRFDRARRADSCVTIPPESRISATPEVAPESLTSLPPEVRRVAAAAGIDSIDPAERLAQLERIVLLQSELASANGEVECLSDHVEDLERELQEHRSAYELAFTVASIAVAAVTGITAGVLELTTSTQADAWMQIGGGLAAGVLGVLAFFPPNETVELIHERNVLRMIWAEEGDLTLPRFVARLVDLPREAGPSPRERLRADWLDLTASRPESRVRLFGDGGRYDADELRTRELMLEMIETEIQLESQELELLLRALERAHGAADE